MSDSKHRIPDPSHPMWGPREVRHPENTPGWFLPYETFLEKYSPAFRFLRVKKLRIEFALTFPGCKKLPGDSEGITRFPWLICLHARTRWYMFREFIDPPPLETLNKWRTEGVRILFRQLAFAEFWQKHPLIWPIQWTNDPERWRELAEERAGLLLLVWNNWVKHHPAKPALKS